MIGCVVLIGGSLISSPDWGGLDGDPQRRETDGSAAVRYLTHVAERFSCGNCWNKMHSGMTCLPIGRSVVTQTGCRNTGMGGVATVRAGS